MDIKLLDCTLRDGGFVNDWEFGNSTIKYVTQRLIKSGMDIVEIGLLDQRRVFDMNRTIFPDTDSMNKVFGEVDKGDATIVAMIDYGTCDVENICPKEETFIDGIRIIFKKPNMYKAIEYGKQLMDKGYFVTLQLVSITSYEDRDILDFCEAANKIHPYGVAIVDTYGLMHKEQVGHYFALLNHNLEEGVAIGYHSHNNFQLAYANTIELLDMKTDRTIILDGSAYGIGKSAGNAPIELLAMHLNDCYGKNYDMNQLLEIIDTSIMPIYNRTPWGYALLYYLAASNNCHPNYISYLLGKSTLSVKSINKIVKEIEEDKKLNYDEKHIKELYRNYQNQKFDDESAITELKQKYQGKDILLLAPGQTISSEHDKIQAYMDANDVEVIAVNFIPEKFKIDGMFVGNSKRYGMMTDQIMNLKEKPCMVATSNVSSLNRDFDYIVNTERVIDSAEDIVDNSTAMVLNLLYILDVASVTLAGFDGYDMNSITDSYCDECFNLSDDFGRLQRVNTQITQKIAEMKDEMHITFLTASQYEGK
ncbi:MAG: aldolase catalytic domain-containing protein [Lachnospiraceae bacterium]|nr:aldolase catalytic domain-containing protein [Lachnospiraceae bacterium]